MDDAKDKALQDIGRGAFESIAEAVAAFECDYDRLQELRDARSDHPDGVAGQGHLLWDVAYPNDAAELADLEKAAGDCEDSDDAHERLVNQPLSLEVRSDWYSPGDPPSTPGEYCILLGTGGPATRIVGDLDANCEPSSARLEVQDWGTPWTEYRGQWSNGGRETLLTFARQFCFGEC